MKNPANPLADQLSVPQTDGRRARSAEVYRAPTMDMLCCVPWADEPSTDEARRWRALVGPFLLPRSEAGQGRIYTARPYPLPWSQHQGQQPLVNGLTRLRLISLQQAKGPQRGTDGVQPGPGDQHHLAWWLGIALAFAHDDALAQQSPQAHKEGTGILYNRLNSLMEECAARAWYDQDLPDWAEGYLGEICDGIKADDLPLYRAWEETQKDLLTVLSTFSRYTHRPHQPTQETDEAVLGCLALRLLAGEVPGRVSDELVERIVWLEKNIWSYALQPTFTRDLRGMIQATWERSLLDRVGKAPGGNADAGLPAALRRL